MPMLRNQLRPAISLTLVLCVVTGVMYPAVVTGLAQLLFPRQANGSLVRANGRVVGSSLIGQAFTQPQYFHPRPSAAGAGYDAAASSGTNKGPTDAKLADTLLAQSVADAVNNDGARQGAIPSDMVTRSASGLDPHISPANARQQVARVARARGVDSTAVRAVLDAHTESRQFGFFGEPRVNVLLLNIALDSAFRPRLPGHDSLTKVGAAKDTTARLTYGGFVDTYFAWDVRQPANFDRSYTTQPARHAEFNVNLAFVEAKLAAKRYRGRLALQWGTSVQANYAAEPRVGSVSGASVSQFLQEATIGYQLNKSLWLDGGILFSHIGYEGWISRDNITYTRSLIADYSPYYEAGAKLTWTPAPALTATIVAVNGWQVISKYNTPLAVGVRLDYVASPGLTLTYANFVGDVAPDSSVRELRVFNEVIAEYKLGPAFVMAGAVDVGSQERSSINGKTATWYGASLLGKYTVNDRLAVIGRVERYADPHRVMVSTHDGEPFETNSGSLGVDVALSSRLLWRSEARMFASSADVWPTHRVGAYAASNALLVSSLGLTF